MVKETTKEEIPQKTFSALQKDEKDFADFLVILSSTGQISLDEQPSELEQAKIIDQYEVWCNQGKPRPKLPQAIERGVEVILRIYRRKTNGKQWLSYVVKGQQEQVGMKSVPIYGQIQDGQEDKSIVIGHDRVPTIEWDEKKARLLLEKAKRYSENVQLCLVYQTMTLAVKNEPNFFGDFDRMVEKAMRKEII